MKPLSDFTTRELLDELQRRMCTTAEDRSRPVRCGVCGLSLDRYTHRCCAEASTNADEAELFT